MKIIKQISIASVIITMFLFSFIGISDAIVIEEMEPSFGEKEDRSGYLYHYTTLGNGVKTYAFNDFTGLYGDLKGTKYTITAKAWILEDDGEFFSATKTYTIRAYQPVSDDDDKLPGVYGLARLFRQYYDGANITINCYILAHNKTNNERKASGKFKHEVSGFPVIERNQPEEIMTANGGSYSKSDSLPQPVGTIGPGDRYESVAYVRLVVKPANWFVGTDPENPVTFTDADTP